jgi:hypothetical protein
MSIGEDIARTGSVGIGIALVILLILGFRWLRRNHDAWYIGFPLTVPIFPLLLLGAGLGPSILLAKSVRLCVIDATGRFDRSILVGTTTIQTPQGAVTVAPPGDAMFAIVNGSPRPYVLRGVTYSNIVVPGMGPKIIETIAPGGVAYSPERNIHLGGAPDSVQGYKHTMTSRLELIPASEAR